MGIRIDGKEIAKNIEEEIKKDFEKIKNKSLEIILVGKLYSSLKYVENKKKVFERLGGICKINCFSENVSQEELEKFILCKSQDDSVGGIIIQHPIPKHLNEEKLNDIIPINKDVDALSNKALEMLKENREICLPATVHGIFTILKKTGIQIENNNFLVMGKSRILGYPLYLKLKNSGANVILVDSKTQDVQEKIDKSKVIIIGIGKPRYLKENMINGQILIDAGYNEGNIGDVDEQAYKKAEMYTPVPGGVGPLTIISLVENFIKVLTISDL